MADQRDAITAALMGQGKTGGLMQQDFDAFSRQLNDPAALQSWLDKGGIYGQSGMTPPDELEQYFAPRGQPSGSITDVGWMNALQPWQGGVTSGGQPGTPTNTPHIGGGSMTRANPDYWGWQGAHQPWSPHGQLQQQFGPRSGGASGTTGGLSAQDFATFSRLVSPQALQDWLSAGGVQGMAGGGMGGAVGGGGGGGGGGGHGPSSGQGPSGSGVSAAVGAVGRGGMSMGEALAATVNATPEGWGTFGNMTGPGIGNTLGSAPSLGGLSGGYNALGNMGTPAGYGNENGFTADGGGLSADGGFY